MSPSTGTARAARLQNPPGLADVVASYIYGERLLLEVTTYDGDRLNLQVDGIKRILSGPTGLGTHRVTGVVKSVEATPTGRFEDSQYFRMYGEFAPDGKVHLLVASTAFPLDD